MDIQRKKILAAMITCATYDEALVNILEMASNKLAGYVCLANVHMVVEGFLNQNFNSIINFASMALPDGKPLGVLMNLLYGTSQNRIAGPDLMVDILKCAEKEKLSVYFYGSTPDTLETMRNKLEFDFPNLKISGMFSPPFRPLELEEDETITKQIVSVSPDIILVSLGCPKQERWMAEHVRKINTVMVGVGAGFSFYTGQVSRAPEWMQQLCLEWLYRIYAEPRRLLKRYLVTNSIFLVMGISQLFMKQIRKSVGRVSNDTA